MTDYAPDEIVDILIARAKVTSVECNRHGDVYLTVEFGDTRRSRITISQQQDTAVRIRRLVPADGEPQAGDLWRDRSGGLYFAQDAGTSGIKFVETVNRGGYLYRSWEDVHREAGPIRLVRREPADAVAETEDAPC